MLISFPSSKWEDGSGSAGGFKLMFKAIVLATDWKISVLLVSKANRFVSTGLACLPIPHFAQEDISTI